MSDHDIAIGPVGIPSIASLAKKPPHLVSLTNGKNIQFFLSLDKPESLNGFIQVKGFYVDGVDRVTEEKISKDYLNIMGSTSKDVYVEMYFPLHRVLSIKNLMFKAK